MFKKLSSIFVLVLSACSIAAISTYNQVDSFANRLSFDSTIRAGAADDFNKDEFKTVTFTDIGVPRITGTSTYDSGVLDFTGKSSTIGYKLKDNDVLFDFNLTYQSFEGNSWSSFNLRASHYGRPHGTNLESRGYVIMIRPNGEVTLHKHKTSIGTYHYQAIELEHKYDVQLGAVNYRGGTIVVLYIDGTEVFKYFDGNSPLLAGDWLLIAADAAEGLNVKATYESKRLPYEPKYDSYTFSTLLDCLTRGGLPMAEIDMNNNVNIYRGTQTIGFNHGLQNFCLGGNYLFTEIASGSTFFINLRANTFSRTSGINTGYAIRLAKSSITLYKRTSSGGYKTLKTASFSFEVNTNYYIEFGTIDYSSSETKIFIKIDERVVAEAIDNSSPYQNPGWVAMNPEGSFLVKIGSKIKHIEPLQYKVIDTKSSTIFKLFLDSAFDEEDLSYEDFDNRIFESVCLDNYSVYNINDKYHSIDENGEIIRAVDIYTQSNSFIIEIRKETYLVDETRKDLVYNQVRISRTGAESGFITPKGYVLKNTYIMEDQYRYKYGYDEMYQKIWEDKIIYNEPCVLIEHDDGIYAQTMYTPTRIIAVKNYTSEKDYSSDDYYFEGNKLFRTDNSPIPYLTKANISCEDVPESIGGTYSDGKGGKILYTEKTGIISYQTMITYVHDDTWTGSIPQKKGSSLPRLQNLLKNKEDIKLVVYGDSIFTGSNSSGKLGVAPYVDMFPDAFRSEIMRKYGNKVSLTNKSVAGKTSEWGAENVMDKVIPSNPNLVLVGFGMNDGVSSSITSEKYIGNINTIVEAIQTNNPDADIILGATIIANSATGYNKGHYKYLDALNEYVKTKENVVVLDMTTLSSDISKTKNGFEMYANNLNHPCDYVARQYVSSLMTLIEE